MPKQGLDDVRGWGSLHLHSLAPGQRWSLQIVKGTAAAGTQCGGRLPPPGCSSRELTADLHTVHSPQLPGNFQVTRPGIGGAANRHQIYSSLLDPACPGKRTLVKTQK